MPPRKRFGQNFLQDEGVITQIIDAIHPQPTDCIVEIGPGQGALTARLLDATSSLTAIELDRDLILSLQQQFGERLNIINADALNVDFSTLACNQTVPNQKIRLVGNLPYNISTPLMFHALDAVDAIVDMHFMLQKEVVTRMGATPGSKDYGRLSIMIQYFCEVVPLFEVAPGAFYPVPKVTSQVVRLIPKSERLALKNFPLFQELVKTAFSYRRKTLSNALKDKVVKSFWQASGFDGSLRPENLSLEEYVGLANALTTVIPA